MSDMQKSQNARLHRKMARKSARDWRVGMMLGRVEK